MKLIPFTGQNILGIDLGTHTIKIVEARFSFGSPVVVRTICQETDSGRFTDPKEKQGIYTAALRKILRENNIQTKDAVIEIPANDGAVKIVKAPANGHLPPPAALDDLPFDLREAETYVQPLHGTGKDGKPDQEVLLAAGNRSMILNRVDILRGAGLNPVIADIDIFAVLNLYMLLEKPSEKDSIVLLDIGSSATNIAIITNGIVKVVRTVFLAGSNLTRTIQSELEVPQEIAEAIKKRHGLLKPQAKSKTDENLAAVLGEDRAKKESAAEELGAKAHDLLAGQMKVIIAEVTRTIAYFTEKMMDPGIQISRVVLTGGSAEMPGLAEFLSAELDVPVEVFRPLKKLGLKGPKEKSLSGLPCFATATGLAFRRPKDHGTMLTRINLLPKSLLPQSHPVARSAVYSACLAVLVTGGYGYNYLQERVEAESLKTKAELSAANMRLKQAKEEMNEKLATRMPKGVYVRARRRLPVKAVKYAYLKGLEVCGVYKDSSGVGVLLNGRDRSFEVKRGKMYDEDGAVVADISALITKNSVILSGGDEKYELPIPK